jgi:methionine-rich copper-binding protein CopC
MKGDEMIQNMLRISVFLLAIAAATPALSHAALNQAEPRVGSTVTTSPSEVVLTFTEQLEPAFSRIEVRDAGGKRVDAGQTKVDGSTMRVPLRPLRAGSYKVNWRALSVDTHKSEGTFSFTMKP